MNYFVTTNCENEYINTNLKNNRFVFNEEYNMMMYSCIKNSPSGKYDEYFKTLQMLQIAKIWIVNCQNPEKKIVADVY
jgi:hypothetical protein